MGISEETVQANTRGEGRGRILDEARHLFLTKGYAETSMQEIADAVRMTKPALYYHFKDKQDLLLAVLSRELEQGHKAFVSILSSRKSLADRLQEGAVWTFSRITGDLGRLMNDMHRMVPPDRVMAFKSQHSMPVDMVCQMLNDAKKSGELTSDVDPRILAQLYIGMIFGQLAMQNSEELQKLDAEHLGKIVAQVFLEGACPHLAR
jgi:AcrR family transcriptional regulator